MDGAGEITPGGLSGGPPRASAAAAGETRAPPPGAALSALYLAVTAVPLAAGGLAGERGWILLLHLVILALLVGSRLSGSRAGRLLRWFGDLHLLVLLPALYAELPLLMEGMPGPVVYHDPLVQRAEVALLGFQPAWTWAGAFPHLLASEVMHLCYLLYYPIIYVPPLLLWTRLARSPLDSAATRGPARADARRALEDTLTGLTLAVVACFVVFVVFPVQGPRYLAAPAGVPEGPFRALTLAILEGGSSRGAAFPSSHVSVAVAQTLLALRFQPRLGLLLAPVTVLLSAGAVYGGFHYAVDAAAGALVGIGAAAAAAPLGRAYRRAFPGFTPARPGV